MPGGEDHAAYPASAGLALCGVALATIVACAACHPQLSGRFVETTCLHVGMRTATGSLAEPLENASLSVRVRTDWPMPCR